MKKTFTINISGTLFHIEEDAYEQLLEYLLKLKEHFGSDVEGREIVADIESRISELFTEKSKGEQKVVVSAWVDEVIKTMGTPEDFREQGEAQEPLAGKTRRQRRLYRNFDNRVIGGVCSGLGAYFNMDPLVMRILFVVLFFAQGIGLLVYLILWIAVPGARTTSQKLEMRGEEVNISNIEKSIRDDVQESKEAAPDGVVSEPQPLRSKPVSTGEPVTDVMKGILKVFLNVLGILLILAGFFGLIGLISWLVVGQSFFSSWPEMFEVDGTGLMGFLSQFISRAGATWGLVFTGLLVGIPLLAILYVGSKLVFNYKSNIMAIGLAMAGIWLIALVGLTGVVAREAANFRTTSSLTVTDTLKTSPEKTMNLLLAEDKFDEFSDLDLDIDRFRVVMVDDKSQLLGRPRLDIAKSSTSEVVMVVKKRSRGQSQAEANNNIQKIIYNYQATDSGIIFDPWFMVGESGKWRDQKVKITLKIPVGTSVFLGEELKEIIDDIENAEEMWYGDMIGKSWVMSPEGLTLPKSLAAKSDSIQ